MRESIVNILSQMLANNIGQRLTPELATGIANTFNQAVIQLEAEKEKPDSADLYSAQEPVKS